MYIWENFVLIGRLELLSLNFRALVFLVQLVAQFDIGLCHEDYLNLIRVSCVYMRLYSFGIVHYDKGNDKYFEGRSCY